MSDALFRTMPKAELHVHLDGSLRPGTMIELARLADVALPTSDPAQLAQWMLVSDARNLEDYLARFEYTIALLQTPEAIERVAYEMVADAHADGVQYIEVRYCPWLSTRADLSLRDAIAAEWRGLERGEREFGVVARIINCALRQDSPAQSLELAEASAAMRSHGVVGFDIAGPEAGYPPERHAEAFTVAARGGLGITVHAGEAAGWESIAEAIYTCRAARIGHGTRLDENPALLEYVRDRRICLEVNITSNVQTRVVRDAAAHPARRYYHAGVVIALCTDSWLMSGVALSDEFRLAHDVLGFTTDELRQVALNGFSNAFVEWPVRTLLLSGAIGELFPR
jgi:adenosine deaminase